MMKNDYLRTLILLRSNAPGYSGHVRLEKRTSMGSLSFLVQSPDASATLRAALAGRSRGRYYACPLGELRRDARGQAALNYTFDPRNICGRELDAYQLLIVSRVDGGCEIVLFGNLNGHCDVDWAEVRRAVCALYDDSATRPPVNQLPVTPPVPPERPGDAVTLPEFGGRPVVDESSTGDTGDAVTLPATDEVPIVTSQARDEGNAAEGAADENALSRLGADDALPWPDALEPLRAAFGASAAVQDAPDNEYIYISMDGPEAGETYLVGLRAENGRVSTAKYAIPDRWNREAPAGLEDYTWQGDANRGWWVAEVDAQSGDQV